jgi:hypothetical protein
MEQEKRGYQVIEDFVRLFLSILLAIVAALGVCFFGAWVGMRLGPVGFVVAVAMGLAVLLTLIKRLT